MKIVIMAGGKGTRIASVENTIPKPMIPIDGKPVLEHELCQLRDQGLTDIILVIGHLGHVIEDYFGDGHQLGVSIQYYRETTPLGTAGALFHLKNELKEDFFLLNGDIVFDIDFARMIRFHQAHHAIVTLLTHPNSHPYDSALIVTDEKHCVKQWINKEETRGRYKNRVNAGIHILSPEVLSGLKEPHKIDLDRDILKPLVPQGRIYAYDSPEYVKDMGTPDRYYKICDDYREGKVHACNLINRQKAVFLDRDGTVNQYRGFINDPKDIVLLDHVAEAITGINESEYLAIIVTNQPVIARGECTLQELAEINNQLETELGKQGAYIDDLFFCPHHPDSGFEGERIEYKIQCDCRKPKPGMLLKAAQKYNIDLSKSFMVGDDLRDVGAGKAAGCKTVLLGKSASQNQTQPDDCCTNLLSFVKKYVTKQGERE